MKDISKVIKLHVDNTQNLFKVPRASFVSTDVFDAERDAIFNPLLVVPGACLGAHQTGSVRHPHRGRAQSDLQS